MVTKLLDLTSRTLLLIAASAFVINVCVLLYGVIARYILGHSPIWMDELSRYLIIGTVMLAAGPAWLLNKHMKVSFIDSILSDRALTILKLYRWLITVGLCGYIAWISWNYAFSVSRFMTMGLGISKTIPLLSLPVGFACLFLFSLLKGPDLTRAPTSETSET